jgi:amino acid transporter
MINRMKYLLLGSPLPTQRLAHEKLNKVRALAAFSPDALSSIAYANQEIYLGLVVAGSAGLALSLPIGLAIAGLLTLIAISYLQTIQGYPTGGGSYIVARENLGAFPGLVAGSALLIDYVLTAAVSLTAGVEAIASAFPDLWPYRTIVALALLIVIALLNLRGLRETGTLMAVPVYLFLFTYLPMLAYGALRLLLEGPEPLAPVAPPATRALTAFLVLRSFSSGCTAMTGIEAISDGVVVFQEPVARNARRTLGVMAVLMGLLFLGSIGLTQALAVVAGPQETILSALARRLLGSGPFYLLIQAATMLVLAVAANTSFADFPRVAAFLATDGYMPRQLRNLGDRLVFSNGILLLAIVSGVLIAAFGGDTHSLVPLFAVGAFLAFTLSQSGMVVHWRRVRGKGWRLKAALNGLGALATGTTLVVVGASKFTQGAWITAMIIPIFVFVFQAIKRHYLTVAKQLSLEGLTPEKWTGLASRKRQKVVMPISGIHRGTLAALRFARSLSKDVTVVVVDVDPQVTARVQEKWPVWGQKTPLVVLPSPYRSTLRPLLAYMDEVDQREPERGLAVIVLPEFIPARWWHELLHNQTARLIKRALIYRRGQTGKDRVIIDVPYHLRR